MYFPTVQELIGQGTSKGHVPKAINKLALDNRFINPNKFISSPNSRNSQSGYANSFCCRLAV